MQGADGTNELVPLKTTFDTAWRGFDRDQVLRHVATVDDEMRTLAADRDATAAQVDELTRQLEGTRSELDGLRTKVDDLHRPPMNAAELSERMNRMLELANAEATEVMARAQAAAEHTWASAEDAAEELRGRYQQMLDDLDVQREQMATEHRETMAAAHGQVEAMTTEAEARRHELDTAAEQRRTRIEEQFDAEMAGRRHDLDQEIARREAESKDEAHGRVAAAQSEAERITGATREDNDRRVAWANHKVEELTDLRERVASQIGGALSLVRDAGPMLAPLAEEPRNTNQQVPSAERHDDGLDGKQKTSNGKNGRTHHGQRKRPANSR